MGGSASRKASTSTDLPTVVETSAALEVEDLARVLGAFYVAHGQKMPMVTVRTPQFVPACKRNQLVADIR